MIRFVVLLMMVLPFFGCQRNAAKAPGGDNGSVEAWRRTSARLQVKIYGQSDGNFVGTGATNWEGRFVLASPDGKGPCWLPAGEYVCELESFGAESPKINPSYRDKAKSPLKLTWTDSKQQMELQIPAK